jgi:Zn-finger nucleic acid-binding protein
VRLVACPACKTHLDVTDVRDPSVHCPCGTTVDAVAQEGVAGTVRRCAGCGASIDERARICGYCQSPIVREPRQLSLSCPECLARNPESGRFCTGCGTEFLPQAPQASSEPKPCPGCEEPLVAQQVRTVWLRACSWCDGLWVPARSLDALVRRMQDGAERAPTEGLGSRRARPVAFDGAVVYRRCPDCRQHMVRKNFGRTSGVIVDWCGGHGTWFDADELERVAAFVAAGGLVVEPVPSHADEVRIVLREAEERAGVPSWVTMIEKLFTALR